MFLSQAKCSQEIGLQNLVIDPDTKPGVIGRTIDVKFQSKHGGKQLPQHTIKLGKTKL